MLITKMALPRRTFLRGMGVTVALPLLDAMVPALSALAKTAPTGAPPRLRLHAERRDDERVDAGGRGAGARRAVADAQRRSTPFKDQVLVPTGLSQQQAESLGDGNGEHSRGQTVWLSGVHPKRTEGADVQQRARPSISSPRRRSARTRALLSIEMALEQNYLVGNCDNGYSCVYWNTISWRTPTTPLPMEVNPRIVFERMFGDGGTPGAAAGAGARGSQHPRFGEGSRGRPAERRLGAGDRVEGRRVPRFDARDRAADPGRREAERRVADRAAGSPDRRARELRRAREADVRPGGAGVPGRHHARLHAAARPRADQPAVSVHRRARGASRDLAPPERSGEARQGARRSTRITSSCWRASPRS